VWAVVALVTEFTALLSEDRFSHATFGFLTEDDDAKDNIEKVSGLGCSSMNSTVLTVTIWLTLFVASHTTVCAPHHVGAVEVAKHCQTTGVIGQEENHGMYTYQTLWAAYPILDRLLALWMARSCPCETCGCISNSSIQSSPGITN